MIIGQVADVAGVSAKRIRDDEQIGVPISEIATFWRNRRESSHEC
jgi:DNA-binding transcriptional MerR regulator